MALSRVAQSEQQSGGSLEVFVAHTEFLPTLPVELRLRRSSRVVVVDATRPEWWFGMLGRFGKSGWFPSSHVEPLSEWKKRIAEDARKRALLKAIEGERARKQVSRRPSTPASYIPKLVQCRICTFQNHAVLDKCKMCGHPFRGEQQVFGTGRKLSIEHRKEAAADEEASGSSNMILAAFVCEGVPMKEPLISMISGKSFNKTHEREISDEFVTNHALKSAIEEVKEKRLGVPNVAEDNLQQTLKKQKMRILKLEKEKAHLETVLQEIHDITFSIKNAAPLFHDPCYPMRLTRGDCDAIDNSEAVWLLKIARAIRRERVSIEDEFVDDIEDELEELVDRFGGVRRKALVRHHSELTQSSNEREGRSLQLSSLFNFAFRRAKKLPPPLDTGLPKLPKSPRVSAATG